MAIEFNRDQEFLDCKQKVFNEIHDIKTEIHNLTVKQDKHDGFYLDIRKSIKIAELQRLSFNKEIVETLDDVTKKLSSIDTWKDAHDEAEMSKYQEIINNQERQDTINKAMLVELKKLNMSTKQIKEDTDANTTVIETLKEYWGRITFTASILVSVAVGAYWLYNLLQKHGLVIIFEKGVGQ